MNDRNRMFDETAAGSEYRGPADGNGKAELVFEDGPNATDYETDAWALICV